MKKPSIPDPKGGIKPILAMLKSMSPNAQEKLLQNLEAKDPTLAQTLRENLFTFEDLFQLPQRDQQMIWNKVSLETLALAIREKKETFLPFLSTLVPKKRFQFLTETLSEQMPQPKSKLFEAQKKILQIAQELENEGKIRLSLKSEPFI